MESLFKCFYGPDPKYVPFSPPTVTPPTGGKALRPQPAISPRRHQTAPCHPSPPPAGIPHSTGRRLRLKPIISARTFIPRRSTLNLLLTSPDSLSLSLSLRWLRQQHLFPMETACAPKYQRAFLNLMLHHGESKYQGE